MSVNEQLWSKIFKYVQICCLFTLILSFEYVDFRCEVPEAVNKIFISFAKAFKKPDGGAPVRSPQSMHEVGQSNCFDENGLE